MRILTYDNMPNRQASNHNDTACPHNSLPRYLSICFWKFQSTGRPFRKHLVLFGLLIGITVVDPFMKQRQATERIHSEDYH